MRFSAVLFLLLMTTSPAIAFTSVEEGCGAGSCADCHSLSTNEAKELFKGLQGEVVSTDFAEVPGLWRIGMKIQDKVLPVYLDFSKSYLISGNVIRLNDRKNLTEARYNQLNPVDLASIPTDNDLLLGNPDAEKKIIVFTDPHCSYCKKLHAVLLQAVEKRPDLLFQIKLMPIKQSSKEISQTIACNKSMEQLEAAFAGETIPATDCETNTIEQNMEIARSLDIRSTPTLILPNGQIAPGYKSLEALLNLIDQAKVAENTVEQ
jgi:thiol:disulfide interchange protein DsbC